MKLFFCLTLFSLSSAEPLFRLPLHQNESVPHHLDQVGNPVEVVLLNRKSDNSALFPETLSAYNAYNVYKRDSGNGFTVSGDCKTSHLSGDYYDVSNMGTGKCYLKYEDCDASTSSGGDMIKKIHDVHNVGAGDFYITYCSASTSGEQLLNDLHNVGAGDFYITYRSASTSGEELINNVYNGGSGKIYIKYSNYGASASSVASNTNIRRKLVNDVHNGASGEIDITYKDCDASTSSGGKLGHDMYIVGSGSIYLTNCCTSTSSVCGELVDNVIKIGSGSCYARNGNDPRCQGM